MSPPVPGYIMEKIIIANQPIKAAFLSFPYDAVGSNFRPALDAHIPT